MKISDYLDKDNPHHAYLVEGDRAEILPEITLFSESLGVKTSGNPDFIHINVDTFKIGDARTLKSYSSEKSFTTGKKIFVVSANNFLLEAQNSLLKMFEEPLSDTHFFLIVPDINMLLKTLISRFFIIRGNREKNADDKEAKEFIKMSLSDRLDFIKELLAEEEEEDIPQEGSRGRALRFLNALEYALHGLLQEGSLKKIEEQALVSCLEHFFKVRKYLRMPGSSSKSLMEGMALSIPSFQ